MCDVFRCSADGGAPVLHSQTTWWTLSAGGWRGSSVSDSGGRSVSTSHFTPPVSFSQCLIINRVFVFVHRLVWRWTTAWWRERMVPGWVCRANHLSDHHPKKHAEDGPSAGTGDQCLTRTGQQDRHVTSRFFYSANKNWNISKVTVVLMGAENKTKTAQNINIFMEVAKYQPTMSQKLRLSNKLCTENQDRFFTVLDLRPSCDHSLCPAKEQKHFA